MINEIGKSSSANIASRSRDEEGFTITGNREQMTLAKRLISEKVLSSLKPGTIPYMFYTWKQL